MAAVNCKGFEVLPLNQMFDEALSIAVFGHYGQMDAQGKSYIRHPLMVSSLLCTEDVELLCIGILHDVIEDSKGARKVTFAMLYERGMSDRVVDGVRCMTRMTGESEAEYQDKLCSNLDSAFVKAKGDLQHNTQIFRLKSLEEKEFVRLQKYHKLFVRLRTLLIENGRWC